MRVLFWVTHNGWSLASRILRKRIGADASRRKLQIWTHWLMRAQCVLTYSKPGSNARIRLPQRPSTGAWTRMSFVFCPPSNQIAEYQNGPEFGKKQCPSQKIWNAAEGGLQESTFQSNFGRHVQTFQFLLSNTLEASITFLSWIKHKRIWRLRREILGGGGTWRYAGISDMEGGSAWQHQERVEEAENWQQVKS